MKNLFFVPGSRVLGCLAAVCLHVACMKTMQPDVNPSQLRQDQLKAAGLSGIPQSLYVSTSGSDGNTGTIGSPLRTINYALSLAGPGDSVIVRQGTYVEKVIFPNSGSTGAYITLKAYTGEQPLISGASLPVGGNEALVRISNIGWVVVDGFEIADLKTATSWNMPDGILVNGTSNNVIIRNNKVHNIENNNSPASGREAHGIHIIGNGTSPITDVLVHNNDIYDNNTGTSENLTINGYVSGFTITNNQIYNGENIAICVAGGYAGNPNPAFNYARNGLIAGNYIWNIDGRTGPVPTLQNHPGTIGIYVDGARNIVVERNYISESDRGIGLVSENNSFPTADCIVRNNVIRNNRAEGIYMGSYAGYTGGGTTGCLVLNNTLYHNAAELGYYNEEVGEIRLNANCTYNEIHNNIIHPRPDRNTFIRKHDATGSFNGIDYNLYYTTGGATRWFWNGVQLNSFSAWKGGSGGDTNGLYANPLFVSTTPAMLNLRIQSTSPAKNAGTNVHGTAAGVTDIDLQPRYNGVIEIGAFELY